MHNNYIYFQFIMVFALVTFGPVEYDDYVYPWPANLIGWCIALSSILCIPGFAIFQFLRTPGRPVEVKYFLYRQAFGQEHVTRGLLFMSKVTLKTSMQHILQWDFAF